MSTNKDDNLNKAANLDSDVENAPTKIIEGWLHNFDKQHCSQANQQIL